jgi:hypothetical protein
MTAVEYLVENFIAMNLIPKTNKHVNSIIIHAIEMEKEQVKSSKISIFDYPNIDVNIKRTINKKFGGDIDNAKTLHSNSICRMAYVGYLRSLGYSNPDVAKITGWRKETIRNRIFKHRSMFKFDKEYSRNFTDILKNQS